MIRPLAVLCAVLFAACLCLLFLMQRESRRADAAEKAMVLLQASSRLVAQTLRADGAALALELSGRREERNAEINQRTDEAKGRIGEAIAAMGSAETGSGPFTLHLPLVGLRQNICAGSGSCVPAGAGIRSGL